ncbi:MAG: FtsW/RodA/SpoVE family cell cycle protein [Hyphomicrobiales bacterium]
MIGRTDRGLLANWWFTVDRKMLSAILLLMAAGVLFIMASSPAVAARINIPVFHFLERQIFFLVPAIAVLIGASMLPVQYARRLAFLGFGMSLALVAMTLVVGPEIKGATRWLTIGSLAVQPSEFLKPAFIVVSAFFMSETMKRPDMPGIWVAGFLLACVGGLLVLQPDFGQTILITAAWITMLFVTGISWIWIFAVAGLGVGGLVLAYFTVAHVTSRIDRFLSPDTGDTFQVDMARDAFEKGGVLGSGPGAGSVKMSIPDAHSDFAFAVIGEEFGAVACVALVLIFAFIVMRGISFTLNEDDPFRRLAVTGLVAIFGMQAVINMGVNVALLPAKGMTLPFISYGGSSLIAMAFGMGLVLALTRRRPESHMSSEAWNHSVHDMEQAPIQ